MVKSASTPDRSAIGHEGGGENSSASPDLRTRPLHEEIAACARDLWRKYGCPAGRDEQIWLEAERQLLGADSRVARVGGSTSADALNQTAPASTASPGSASANENFSDRRKTAVGPAPASSGRGGR